MESATSRWRSGLPSAILQILGYLLAVGLVLGVWLRPAALAIYHLEVGGRAMVRAQAFQAAHPTAVNEALDQAVRHFQRAIKHAPADGYAYRRLGQAWLLAGNNELAQQALTQAAELRPHDPMIQIELGHAFDGLGHAEQAVAAYARGRYGPAVSEAIVNYLKLADWQIDAQGGDTALKILQDKALMLDPNSLPALNRVALLYEGMSKEGMEFAQPIRALLQEFPLESTSAPTEPRLAQYLAHTMVALVQKGIWQKETLLAVVARQVWDDKAIRDPAVEQLLQTLVEQWPGDAELLFYQGELYARRGDLDLAEAAYRQVVALNPAHAQVYIQLGMIGEARAGLARERGLAEAAQWYGRHFEVAPDDLVGFLRLSRVCLALDEIEAQSPSCREAVQRAVGSAWSDRGSGAPAGKVLWSEWRERVAAVEPSNLVGQRLEDGWLFIGYDLDEDRLILGEPVDLLLYWAGPAEADFEQDGWVHAGDRWVQHVHGVTNLISNGGFELGTQDGSPTGFPYDLYDAGPGTRQLVVGLREGLPTTVALLDGARSDGKTSFASTYLPVNGERWYLQAGWVKSAGGNAFLGCRWAGEIKAPRPYGYIAALVEADKWQHFAGLAQPPDGADLAQLWLLNYQSPGRVYFDGLVFVEIIPPGRLKQNGAEGSSDGVPLGPEDLDGPRSGCAQSLLWYKDPEVWH